MLLKPIYHNMHTKCRSMFTDLVFVDSFTLLLKYFQGLHTKPKGDLAAEIQFALSICTVCRSRAAALTGHLGNKVCEVFISLVLTH